MAAGVVVAGLVGGLAQVGDLGGQGVVGHLLQVGVDVGDQVVAGGGRGGPEGADHLALGVHLELLGARRAPQLGLVLQLQAALTVGVTLLVALGGAGLQLLGVDGAHVAEHLRRRVATGRPGQLLLGVVALGGGHRRDPRELGGVLSHVEDVGQRRVGQDGHGLVDAVALVVDRRLDLGGGLADQGGQATHHRRVLDRGHTGQRELLDHLVVDQRVAVAVEDEAPGGLDLDGPDLVDVDLLGGGRGLQHGQGPQAEAQHSEEHQHEGADDLDPEPGPRRAGVRGVEDRRHGEPVLVDLRLPGRLGAGPASLLRPEGAARTSEGVA